MFKTRIIIKLIVIFILFAAMIVVPYTLSIVNQVKIIISEEEELHQPVHDDYKEVHREFVPRLLSQTTPYVFYIVIMAFLFSMFFMRKMLLSLKALQRGSRAVRDGDLDTHLEIIADDEIGDVTTAFNEMTAALREKTRELQKKDRYISAMLDPLWVVDEDNVVVDINPAFTRLFGYDREHVLGASIFDFLDEKNAAIMRFQLLEKREKGIASMYEISVIAKDGSQIPVLISGSPIYSNGRIVGKIGILKDFREQMKLRAEIQQSGDYAETIMDSIHDELLVIDKDYRIIKANRIALSNAQRPIKGEFCHVVSHEIKRPCWEAGHECPVQMVFATKQSVRTTHRHNSATGETKIYEIMASPVKDAAGNVIHVIELLRDVTDRSRHEEEIFQKNRELVALNRIAETLGKSLRADEIFSRVLDRMIEMMEMDGGGIYFIDESKKEMVCQYHKGISDEYVKTSGRMRLGEDIPGKVAVTGQIISSQDISKDPRVERSIFKHSGIRGYCCIPIRGKERIVGVICLFSFSPHVFNQEEDKILVSIGEMTGIALDNIRLYENMRELYESQRKRREDEHAQLLSLSKILGSSIELRDIMNNALDLVKNFFRADFVWLLSLDGERNMLLRSAPAFTDRDGQVIYQNGISSIEGYAVEKRRPVVIEKLTTEEKFYLFSGLLNNSYQTAVAVPLFIGDKPVGVYSFYYLGTKSLKEEEIHFLQIIGNILAVSLERFDLYEKSIIEKGLADTILQSVTDGIITVDTSGKVVSLNRAVEWLTGFSAAYAVGLPVCDILRYTDENTDFRFLLADCLESALSGSGAGAESTLVTAYGNRRTIMVKCDPVIDASGSVIGAVNLLRDITREKEIDRMKTDLIRSVSHEFRTPLSAIVGMTEMILDGDLDQDKNRQYLKTILSEGIRLSSMVSDLLSIARIESGKESMDLKPIDMKTLVKSVIESFASITDSKHADIRYHIHENGEFVGDEAKIKQLLMNILDNALTFSENECRIEIAVKRKNDDYEIKVSDNGWGIPEEDVPHLGKRFYRGKHGEKIKGTGLGLSLCNEIVRMHGGSMKIKSTPGKGTEVIISIPLRRKSG